MPSILSRTLLASILAVALPAHADIVSLDLHSGIDANGTVLAAGALDPFWMISTDGASFASARVAYPGAYPDYNSGQICCGMETVDGTAAWITTPGVVATSPTTGWGISNMVYARRAVDLTGYDLETVSFSGRWRVADVTYGVYVNGQLIPGTNYQQYAFSSDLSFNLAAGGGLFVDGINTIELRGQSVNNVWDAFWISTTMTGDVTAVPEPETWALMLTGLALVGFGSRRNKA
ncbi:MAG: PEPxxWA-CTERM sorting domain-containing protein [Pseudomonadota bacterium]